MCAELNVMLIQTGLLRTGSVQSHAIGHIVSFSKWTHVPNIYNILKVQISCVRHLKHLLEIKNSLKNNSHHISQLFEKKVL